MLLHAVIDRLHVGLVVRLPSGAVLRLVRRQRDGWVCEYLERAPMRGEVEFSGAFLRRHGTALKGSR